MGGGGWGLGFAGLNPHAEQLLTQHLLRNTSWGCQQHVDVSHWEQPSSDIRLRRKVYYWAAAARQTSDLTDIAQLCQSLYLPEYQLLSTGRHMQGGSARQHAAPRPAAWRRRRWC